MHKLDLPKDMTEQKTPIDGDSLASEIWKGTIATHSNRFDDVTQRARMNHYKYSGGHKYEKK